MLISQSHWRIYIIMYYVKKLQNTCSCIEDSQKPSSPVSGSFTQIIQQGCSTDTFRNYIWFHVLCYPCYPFKCISLDNSSCTVFSTPLSLSQTSNTSSKQSKNKSDIQTIHSNRLSAFHLETHLRSTL